MEFQNAKFSDDVSSRAIYVLGSNVFRLLQISGNSTSGSKYFDIYTYISIIHDIDICVYRGNLWQLYATI